jgi:hypothetical protein
MVKLQFGSVIPFRNVVTPSLDSFLIPFLLFLVYLAQCLWFVSTQSFTVDEPFHIIAGLEAWRHGNLWAIFSQDETPPLARMVLTMPLVGGDWQSDDLLQIWRLYRHLHPGSPDLWPDPEVWTWYVRPMNIALGLVLGGMLWSAARRFFSTGAANLALALFVFSPALIAHFSLATPDGMATLLLFAVAIQFAHWRRNASLRQTAILGILLGGLVVTKLSGLPIVVTTVLMVLVTRQKGIAFQPMNWRWGQAMAVAVLVALCIWATYRFHVSDVTLRNGQVTIESPNATGHFIMPSKRIPNSVDSTFMIPAGEFLSSVLKLVRHSQEGHPSYFLGELSPTGGWRSFFVVAILLKWPPSVLFLAVASTILFLRRQLLSFDAVLIAVFPTVLLMFAIFSKINIGDRHILPIYPFILLLGAGSWEFARSHRAGRLLVVALVLATIVDISRYAPNYLSYFTPLVNSNQSYQLLTDSSLDWGQGLLALREYQAAHPDEQIYLAYFGSVDPSQYGIRASYLPENERVTGTVVVSATYLTGQTLGGGLRQSGYQWVLEHPRKTILNHSLHVFEVRE